MDGGSCGHNRYRDKSELIVKYWKKYFPKDFKRIQQIIASSDKKVVLPETAQETVRRIVKQNNIKKEDIGKLYESSKKQSSSQMQKEKQKAMDKIISSLPKKSKKYSKNQRIRLFIQALVHGMNTMVLNYLVNNTMSL